jgi:hypothetical protein
MKQQIFNGIHVHFSLSYQSCNEFHSHLSKTILEQYETALRWCCWVFILVRIMFSYLCQLSMSRNLFKNKGTKPNWLCIFHKKMNKMLFWNPCITTILILGFLYRKIEIPGLLAISKSASVISSDSRLFHIFIA